ncbi:hypothetical protein D9M68_417910 [compost metagenome]
MKRSGSAEPWATAANAPMPSFSTSFGPSTSHLMRGSFASPLAASASSVGVAWLAGRLPHSLASSMPATVARASSKALVTAGLAASATPSVRWRMLRGSAFDLVVV